MPPDELRPVTRPVTRLETDEGAERPAASDAVRVMVCEDGPLIVRGPATIVDEQGREVERRRATVALCRCGLTGRAPWCDGTHKVSSGPRRGAAARRRP